MQIVSYLKLLKKRLIFVIIIFIIIAGGYYFFTRPKEVPLQLAGVKIQNIQSTISAAGILSGKKSASLHFKSSGKLSYINVKTGDKVSAGQVIAGLDTQNLSIALQQAENAYRDKQAIAQKIEDDVKDHDDDETFTQKANRTTAQAARDSAYDAVKEARRAFQDTVIVSPIDGIVTSAIEVPGQTVTASDIIAQVVDNSETYFDAEVDEADIGSVS